jgi:tight adherence protein C
MIALFSGLSIAAAVLLAALALRPRSQTLAASRIAELKPGEVGRTDSTSSSQIGASGGRLDDEIERWVPAALQGTIQRALAAAGNPKTQTEFVLFAVLLGVSFSLSLLVLTMAAGGSLGAVIGLGLVGAVAGGFGLPALWLRRRMRSRRSVIWRSLPDAADLLTTCVEAGLDINASFARVALEMPGPLQEEVQIMLREVSLGRRRRDALNDIGDRTGVEDLGGMLTAIIQAEESGTTLGGVLRAQSKHIRAARRLFAEQRARVVPAKMTFPIIFLIVPTLFVLILGPLGIQLWETFLG